MSNHDTDKHDIELASYLEGNDGLSSLYRQVPGEFPPAELDEQILQASRVGLPNEKARRPSFFGPYRMAASLALIVFFTALYVFEPPPEPRVSRPAVAPVSPPSPASDERAREEAEVMTLSTELAPAPAPATGFSPNMTLDSVQAEAFSAEAEADVQTTAARSAELTAVPLYRTVRQQWLEEIQRLRDENDPAVENEIRLFTETYPDEDIEQALSELED